MSVKTYQLFCDYCSYKRITDGSDIKDLREIKQSPVPGGTPYLDPLGKKEVAAELHQPAVYSNGTIVPRATPQRKKFKCPRCGRVIMARQIQKTEHFNEASDLDGRETGFTGPSFP